MGIRLYHEYELKFYLNARHYIIIGGQQGDVHPHTWEFSMRIRIGRSSFTPFMVFEKKVNALLEPYQNRLINDVEPFDQILPTLENMVDYFARQAKEELRRIGGELIRVEASETPTRAYILDLQSGQDPEREAEMLPELVDSVLDDILTDLREQGDRG